MVAANKQVIAPITPQSTDLANRSTEQRDLSQLTPHPRQATFFGDVSEPELLELIKDMTTFGQLTPVQITRDGVIISGHQRLAAAKRLGWKQINVVIIEGSADELERRFIAENAVRRQLSPLQRAHCAARLMEIEKGKPRLSWHASERRGQVREHVGKLLTISGREVDRLLRVLDAPLVVQLAYEAGRLSLDTAGKVAALKPDARQKVEQQICDASPTANLKKIILPFLKLGTKQAGPTQQTIQYRRLLAVLEGTVSELTGNVDTIEMVQDKLVQDLQILEQAATLIPELIQKARSVQETIETQRLELEQNMSEVRSALVLNQANSLG